MKMGISIPAILWLAARNGRTVLIEDRPVVGLFNGTLISAVIWSAIGMAAQWALG